jgi:hypothetical protein
MTVWADADSLPEAIRTRIRIRIAGERTRRMGIELDAVFASNKPLPESRNPALGPGSSFTVVEKRSTVDDFIVTHAHPGDLVVTRDIPLAERMLASGVAAMNDRGDEWKGETIRERRSMRDFMAEARSSGLVESIRKKSFGVDEERAFANSFDRALTRLLKKDTLRAPPISPVQAQE